MGLQKDGLAATYSYLPDGMRSEKTVNGVTTGHLWDGTNMVAETSGDAVVYKYVRGAGLLYAENATDEKTWYVKDAHGDTVQLTDGNGNIVRNYAYDAFGNQKETVNSGTEPYTRSATPANTSTLKQALSICAQGIWIRKPDGLSVKIRLAMV